MSDCGSKTMSIDKQTPRRIYMTCNICSHKVVIEKSYHSISQIRQIIKDSTNGKLVKTRI